MKKIIINNKEIEVDDNATILDAAKIANIHIPTLCHMNLHNIKTVNDGARCRVCMVEVEGKGNLAPACATNISDGMIIKTNSTRAIKARRSMVELLLSNHPKDCLVCPKNGKCELQTIASELGVREVHYEGKRLIHEIDDSSCSFIRNKEKCILCGRCETMCNVFQTVGVYSKAHRGFDTIMTTAFDQPIVESPCTFCGQCVSVCPTAALTEIDNTPNVWDAINDPEKYVIVQTAPAIRVALGEGFGLPVGTDVTSKMITALRELGFDKVYDTDFAADLTVIEETHEFMERLKNNGPLPILTSCCPAWVNFIECNYGDLLDIPSSCKSPHEMFGAIAKTYLAQKLNIDPKKMVVVSIMPCLAKKFEAERPELADKEKQKNVDYVLSTRELSRMIKEAGIEFNSLEDNDFDKVMGESTGASVIFGATGGVIEAVVRNAAYILNNEKIDKIDFTELRGLEGIREATVNIKGTELKIAIANGLRNARILLDKIRNKEAEYHAIEIMACPGGCIGGGGQPYYLSVDEEILNKRREAIYRADIGKEKRISMENEEIQALYKDFLGEVGSHTAHELLHTSYKEKEK